MERFKTFHQHLIAEVATANGDVARGALPCLDRVRYQA